ncbi:type I polyketide synthase [Kitasatospora sp. NPDC093806]|uniref:type I polyketide synthase n=1 Tax=Kitasatospora sp. NPDC093806 TaxID=3155075 RepID=UPI00341413DE
MPVDKPAPPPAENTGPTQPIAIIGMAGRFAGASDLHALWELLVEGRDAIRDIPASRYDIDAVYDPEPRKPGRTVSRWGGLLDGIAEFDTEFFGISPREADRMDPQQRLLLEITHEALEDAGQSLDRIKGTDGGVFVGQLGGDYWHLQYRSTDRLDLYAMTGAASRAIMSGRLSYAFDLRGPSLTVDTACSSALVAVHNAVQALRLGECGLAIAGGVNLVLLPEEGIVYSGAGMLAKDGRCKFGDATGDGFVRSDGVGAVVLKPLDAALADGDRIRAVIRGSAIGNDGQSSGYLVTPAVEGQRDVLVRAYRNAGIDPADVDYIEAHGTGTSVGDPVELEALADVVGRGRPAEQAALVGSIKTNIGHAEAAAGIAGLIKTVLCLEHGTVPPNLHFRTPNPAVPWDRVPLSIPTTAIPLPDRGRPALAGVSSFGFSGTNAHIVLEAAPPNPSTAAAGGGDDRAELLTLSARSPEALAELATRMADHLTSGPGRAQSLLDICHSAALRRSHLDSRLALAVTGHEQAAEALRVFADGEQEPGLSASDYTDPESRPRIAFVFPGQGSQWVGMARRLLEEEPAFAGALAACDEAIERETGWSVLDVVLTADEAGLNRLDVIQPTLWAIEIALAALWRSWGVEPDVVIGHSMGESAAAYVAGSLSLADAAAVICRRSRLAKRLTGLGTMAWVALPAAEAAAALAGYEDSVAVAAANSPTATLLSGEPAALAQVSAALEARGVTVRPVKVDFASHCPQMDALRDDLLAELAHLAPRAGTVPMHSTLLDEVVDGSGLDAEYWVRNIREPVDFVGVVSGQLALGETVFIELSPHPILAGNIRETGRSLGLDTVAVGSLRRHEDERYELLTSAGALHTAGVPVDLGALTAGGRYVPLPSYPWQRTHHWLPEDSPATTSAPHAVPTPPVPSHPLLGPEATVDGPARAWEGPLDLTRNAYLIDHQVQGSIILPGTAHLELLAAATRAVLGDAPLALADVRYHRALFLDEDGPAPTVRVTLSPTDDGQLAGRVLSRTGDDESWTLHTEATTRALDDPAPPAGEPVHLVRARCTEHQTGAEFYPWNAERGNQWAGTFQGVSELWRTDGEVLARVSCPQALLDGLDAHVFHPALLDSGAHAVAAARPATVPGQDNVFVLGGIEEIHLYRSPGTRLWSHARLVPVERADSFAAELTIRDDDGEVIAEVLGIRLQYLAGSAPALLADQAVEPRSEPSSDRAPTPAGVAGASSELLYDLRWEPAPARPDADVASEGSWIVLTDSGPTGRTLVRELAGRGQRAVVVTVSAGYQAGGADRFRIDPANPEHYRAVLADAALDGGIRGVVHLWALDATPGLDATAREIARAQLLSCHSVLHLVQALDEIGLDSPELWLVTRHAQSTDPADPVSAPFQAPLWGLGRTLAAEHRSWRTRLADVDRDAASLGALADLIVHPDAEDQIALRGGRRLAARLVARAAPGSAAEPTVRVSIQRPGVLDDLGLEAVTILPPGPGEVVLKVSHAALNYRDVLMAIGMYPGQGEESPRLGWECAGTVEAVGPDVDEVEVGDRVIAFTDGAMATRVVTKAVLTAPMPAGLTPAEAATLPASYLTAYHALHGLADVAPGDRVLIHSATGGTGLAALNVARWKGAEVFATAGSAEKRALLRELGVQHVADSRSLAFVDSFRLATDKAGFDVIVNTLAGEAIPANLSLMAPYGRYIELSKRDIIEDEPLPLGFFARNLSFHAVDLVHMVQHQPRRAGALLRAAAELVGQGVLRPLPFQEFPADRAAEAFRLMSQSRHTGKIVLSFPDVLPDHRSVSRPVDTVGSDTPIVLGSTGTYLVTGGAGGIGGRLATWLVEHGARHLLLTGRSPLPDPAAVVAEDHPQAPAVALLRDLAERGAEVEYAAVDVADLDAMRSLLDGRAQAGKPPLSGVLHAAGTIDYAPLRDFDTGRLDAVLRAKVTGAWNLHRLTRDLPLDLFVLFSSGSALLGSPFLGGYAAGNAFLDSLAHHRDAQGLPATVVNWGFWESVGMVARKEREDGRSLLPRGMGSFTPDEGLSVLGRLLDAKALHTVVLRADWPTWAQAYPAAADAPLLHHLTGSATAVPARALVPTGAARTSPAPAEREQDSPAEPVEAVDDLGPIQEFLVAEAAQVLGLRPERINANRPLQRMGMDSLMAVEYRNRIERRYRLKLPIVELLKGGTIASVTQALAAGLADSTGAERPVAAAHPAPAEAPAATPPAPVAATPVVEPATPAPVPVVPTPSEPATPLEPSDAVQEFLVAEAAQVLGLRPERINANRPLQRMGMDSLMAVEYRNRIERRYRLKLPIVELLKGGTIASVTRLVQEGFPVQTTADEPAAAEEVTAP